MSQITPRLALPLIQPAQAQKHVTHNSAIEILDAITQLNVIARDVQTPPVGASEGDSYALGTSPTGDWVGQDGNLAVQTNGGWMFIAPREGWRLWDAQTSEICVFTGTSWQAVGSDLQNISGVGINTTSDANNGLAVASPAVLLTHGGGSGGHQLKINKATAGDTASLLFQTGWSGRAEMGTTGSDNFAIKVSADGSTFTDALTFDAASGIASGAAVQQSVDDITAGRLMRADFGYSPTNIVGTVSELGGVPTGAIVESGRTNDGDYVRYADGTQICAEGLNLGYNDIDRLDVVWNFPVQFFGNPQTITGSINVNSFRSNATPGIDEIGGLMHSNANSDRCTIVQYRISGLTDFLPTDTTSCRVLAVGRWY